jgi:ribose transport system substrate-binding protein
MLLKSEFWLRSLTLFCMALIVAAIHGDNSGLTVSQTVTAENNQKISVTFVTNQIADFWKIAQVGAEDAAKEFDVDVQVLMPDPSTVDRQKQVVEDVFTRGIKGIAISPIDADNQTTDLNKWASKVPLITHDSDAPNSKRLVYIGMDNYAAGRDVGKLMKKALPDGGNVILMIGRLEQDNAKKRWQGVVDELLDRDSDPSRYDDNLDEIAGDKFTIIRTLTDGGDSVLAKSKAADSITTYPELNGFISLFEYEPPQIYEAVKQAKKLGKIKMVGFDENSVTLQAIKDGHITGTVVQNPYAYGYESVRVLSELLRGKKDVIPESKFIDAPHQVISKDNVDAFWEDLKAKTGQ